MMPPSAQSTAADRDAIAQAQAEPEAASDVVTSRHDLDLRRQLHHVLEQLALAHQRCEQLEAQLRDGQLRERRQLHRAEHDDLTGLLNRTAFRERLQRALASGAQVAVMMLDLDGFKLVNDHHGHAAGDEVLRIIAARMAHALRSGDMVGRLGGDEFACLLQNAGSLANLVLLGGKLSTSIASPMQVAGHRLVLQASLGLGVSPDDGASVDALLTSADAAMYRAKRHGKNGLASPVPPESGSTHRPEPVSRRPNGLAPEESR